MKTTFDRTQIRNYLLGTLPEDEIERLDEAIFTDDEVLVEIESAEMALIDDYILGRLSPEIRKLFEASYLTTPERRAKINEAAAFHRELTELRTHDFVNGENAGWFRRLFSGWSFSFPTMQYAAVAAVLLLVVSTGWLLYDGWKARNELMIARNSLANSDANLNDRLAERNMN